jgi:Alr-MurF fusion protein
MYTINEVIKIIGAKAICNSNKNHSIEHLSIDSRTIGFDNNTLFFALNSTTRDGHQFIQDAYNKGVRNFIVSKKVNTNLFPDSNILVVPSVLQALQQLAVAHRIKHNVEVIGITGSNGKTIVKEWLNQLLQPEYNIVRSPKSYNSQIGVALSVWQMQPKHNLAIFEAGVSEPEQMQALQLMIQPTIGILTNIGEAHNEGFNNSYTNKLNEKIKLFTNCKTIIYNATDESIDKKLQLQFSKKINLVSWGKKPTHTIYIQKQVIKNNSTLIKLQYSKQQFDIQIPFNNAASIENAMYCVALLLIKKYSQKQINTRLQLLQQVALRLQLKKGKNQCVIINDTYSNDVNSLAIALDYLQLQPQPKTVVLTDMQQTGETDEQLYTTVAKLIASKKINNFIGVGKAISKCKELFSATKKVLFFATTSELQLYLTQQPLYNQAILFKGARSFALEQVAQNLEEKVHQTILEVDVEKLIFNIKQHQQILLPSTKIMAIVKAFGYGNGSVEVAQVLQQLGVAYLAVAYADEGVALRKAGIHLPIMVMNVDAEAFDTLIQHNLEPELYSINILHHFIQFAQQQALTNYPVHIKIDTGMHRLGFETAQVKELCNLLQAQNVLKVQSILSHLVGSDDTALDAFTKLQNEQFVQIAQQIETALDYTCIKHIANTSAIQRHKKLQHQMVRLGIGMYGVQKNKLGLQQVCTLKTTIAQIKRVPKTETIGYNRKGVLKKDSIIATIRIGYADGYTRNLGNGAAKVLVNGQLAPTIGNICMDMTMIDITNIPNVQEGDYVTLFGETLTVQQLATWSNTIPYEILTNISERVKRVYVGS